MKKELYVIKTTAIATIASLAITLATASVGFCRNVLIDANHSVSQTGVLIGGGGGGGLPDLGPDDPTSKPRIPGQPTLVERNDTSLTIQWTDNSSYEQGYNLYRGPDYGGPWTRIAVFGATPGNTTVMQYTDTGLPRDTRYYYRVGAYNYYGESFSTPQTFATIDGRGVSRLQLRLRTANVADANTDDGVNVSLRDNDGGGTWLDYGRNDFERGDEFTYELILNGISDLSDINNIFLLKPGTDGWCIESLALLADGVEIFNQQFGSTPSTCQWLDDENGHDTYFDIGRPTLRAHPLWQAYQQPFPSLSLLRTDLEARIEGIVGNKIHYGTYVDAYPIYQGTLDVSWTHDALDGASHVKVSKKDAQAVHVEFKLDIDTPGPGSVTATSDFDLRFTGVCRTATDPAKILITTENRHATADFNWLADALTLWLIELADGSVADDVAGSIPDFSQTITIDNQIVSCVTPSVAGDGTVDFNVAFAKVSGTVGGMTTTGTITGGTKTTGMLGTTTTKAVLK